MASNDIACDYVQGWFWQIGSDVSIPPLCLELVLRDGSHHFVRCVVAQEQSTRTAVIRVWDLRALSEDDLVDLQARLPGPSPSSPSCLHPKLDQSNLRIPMDAVWYLIEHHDRFWPENARTKVGF